MKQPLALLSIFFMASLFGGPVQGDDLRWDDVQYSDAGGTSAVGNLVRPDKEEPLPGIILIHEWWGLNEDIKSKAREFANLGYVALAVDMYDGKSTTDASQARELAGQVRGNMEIAQENLRDAIGFLKESRQSSKHSRATTRFTFTPTQHTDSAAVKGATQNTTKRRPLLLGSELWISCESTSRLIDVLLSY